MPQPIQVSASDSGIFRRWVSARDCSGSANSLTISTDSRLSASLISDSISFSTFAMTSGFFARAKNGSTISRYSVCSGGFVSMGSCRIERTSSSDGIGTRNGASELNVFQSFAARRTSSCRRIIGTLSPWNSQRKTPVSLRGS